MKNFREGRYEDKKLYDSISHAIGELKKDYSSGIRIPHKLIPTEYIKNYGIDNLRKTNLPDGWRLLYTVQADKIMIVSVILEWLDHKNYERRFKY